MNVPKNECAMFVFDVGVKALSEAQAGTIGWIAMCVMLSGMSITGTLTGVSEDDVNLFDTWIALYRSASSTSLL
jgi:hypothetical protein